MSNILITSAGRRVELVKEFMRQGARLGAEVYAIDVRPELSAACQVADRSFAAPPALSDEFEGFITDFCTDNEIGVVIPTIDTELLPLAKVRGSMEQSGTAIVVADSQLIEACMDKRKTPVLYDEIGLEYPEIFDRHDLRYPLFCKPYDGSSSEGAFAAYSAEQLLPHVLSDPKNMFMELVDKTYSEYTCDAYYDRFGSLKCLVPRERLETRAGEVSKGVTRRNFVYSELWSKLSQLRGARGCITVQVFVNIDSCHILALEINPRFGGGYPLSCSAGASFPEWILNEYLEGAEVQQFEEWEADLCMLRYDAAIFFGDR